MMNLFKKKELKRIEELEQQVRKAKVDMMFIGEWFDDYVKGNHMDDNEILITSTVRSWMKES